MLKHDIVLEKPRSLCYNTVMSSPELTGANLRFQQAEILRTESLLACIIDLVPADTTVVPDVDVDPPFDDSYGDLSRRLCVSYHEALPGATNEKSELIDGENAVGGFDAMARILSFGPVAYADYCLTNGTEPNLAELVRIMRNSYDTAGFFMSMRGQENNVYEETLAISVPSGNPERPKGIFVIAETEQGLKIVPVKDRLKLVEDKLATELSTEPAPEQWQKCPARTIFGYRLWQRMIDLSESDPRLFQADLAASKG